MRIRPAGDAAPRRGAQSPTSKLSRHLFTKNHLLARVEERILLGQFSCNVSLVRNRDRTVISVDVLRLLVTKCAHPGMLSRNRFCREFSVGAKWYIAKCPVSVRIASSAGE